jgi:hypothetical protein
MTQQARLTVTEANEIGGAIHDLDQLETKSIKEKDDAAKGRALHSFLQDKMVLHSMEFLSAWFTLEQEYKPYLSSQASMLGNVLTIVQRRQQIMEAQAKQPPVATEEQPKNVVQLVTK